MAVIKVMEKMRTAQNKFRISFAETANIHIVYFLLAILLIGGALSFVPQSYAHFDHFSLYNGKGEQIGDLYAYQALDPDYARPDERTRIMFSIQDKEGRDVSKINTMLEVYSANSGERIYSFPWTKQESGDFELDYIFPQLGNYQLVLSITEDSVMPTTTDPARSILSSNKGCLCDRTVFNVSITDDFGTIWNSTMAVSILGPLAIIGIVLSATFRNRMRSGNETKISVDECIKYSLMLAAIAGGIVHLAVYSMHASLRLEYSIFLISAGGMQVAYGVLYIMDTVSRELWSTTTKTRNKGMYRKTMSVNIFGLVGSLVLLGLYAYSVIFPPPLSPANVPNKIEFAGILAKSLEAFLVVGIIFIIWRDKKKMAMSLSHL